MFIYFFLSADRPHSEWSRKFYKEYFFFNKSHFDLFDLKQSLVIYNDVQLKKQNK